MSFEPMTTVRLLTGVPLDNTYSDTLTFSDPSFQTSYFTSKTKDVKNELTYQREQLYVDYPAEYDSIIDCNYLMYQNAAFNTKWFYGFIVKIEYWSEGLTRIYFEVDSYQTFMFDVQVKPCFVEREHVNDDSVGANLIDEGLSLGDFVCNGVTEHYYNDWWIVVGSNVDLSSSPEFPVAGGKFYGGTFSGIRYYCYSSAGAFNAMLDLLSQAGKLENIVMVFMLPKEIVSPNQSSGEELEVNPSPSTAWNIPNTTSLNGYTPINNKLLTYPYRYVSLSNQAGSDATLRYEFWAIDAGELRCMGSISPNGKIWCWPQSYKGIPANFDEGVSVGNYPVCSWSGNTYANWVAQQQVTTAMGLSAAVVSSGAKIATGNVASGIASLVSSAGSIAYNNMLGGIEHSFTPSQSKGNTGGENFQIMYQNYGFIAKAMSITADYAKTIDNYFNAFGYKVNKVKIPNITGRPSWNYVKTVNAKIVGKCPAEHIDNIKNMLNRGVTFWHGDYVGDYSRPNK